MRNRVLGASTAATAVLALAGCSSEPPEYEPAPGALVPGSAQLTVNGADAGTTHAVDCSTTGPLSTLETGGQDSGITAMVSNQDVLTAEFVRINDVGGFTGSYNKGLGDNTADVTMTGQTYTITGIADGLDAANPSFRVSGTFTVKVAC